MDVTVVTEVMNEVAMTVLAGRVVVVLAVAVAVMVLSQNLRRPQIACSAGFVSRCASP